MDKKSIHEMEQIQKGLEEFLERELAGFKSGRENGLDKPAKDGFSRVTGENGTGMAVKDGADMAVKDGADMAVKDGADMTVKDGFGMASDNGLSRMAENGFDPDREAPPVRKRYRDSARLEQEDSYWEDWDAKEEEYDGEEEAEETVTDSGKRRQTGGNGQSRRKSAANGKARRSGEKKGRRSETDAYSKMAGRKTKEKIKGDAKGGKKKRGAGLKKFLIVVVILGALLGYGWYSLVGMVYDKMTYENKDSLAGQPMMEEDVVNILLIGNDSRENSGDGRSDAMILLSVSSRTKTIYMTSLLRDIYVEIPGHQGNRLNAAFSYGGPELLLETVEQNFGIHVNRYMLVNFQAFANLVDAVGGVDLELTKEEVEYVNGYLVEYNMLTGKPEGTDYLDTSVSGMIHLNGPQALAYSRNRYLGTDFGRTERQRKVLSGVMAKAPGALLSNPKGLLDVLSNLTTNLTQGECLRLSLMAGRLLTYDIVQNTIPVQGTYENAKIRGMAVLKLDFEKNRQYLQDTIYGDTPKQGE